MWFSIVMPPSCVREKKRERGREIGMEEEMIFKRVSLLSECCHVRRPPSSLPLSLFPSSSPPSTHTPPPWASHTPLESSLTPPQTKEPSRQSQREGDLRISCRGCTLEQRVQTYRAAAVVERKRGRGKTRRGRGRRLAGVQLS